MRDNNCRVRLRPRWRLKTVDVPSLHQSSGGRSGLLAIADSRASHSELGANARRACSAVIGLALAGVSFSRSLGNPSFMLWRMASATDKPVSFAVRRTSPRRSWGIASGYVSLLMEESYMLDGKRQAGAPVKIFSARRFFSRQYHRSLTVAALWDATRGRNCRAAT